MNRSLESFTGEVLSVGAVLVTVSEHRIMKDQFTNFQDKVKQYVLHELYHSRGIIIFIWDIKNKYAHVDIDKPA